MKEQEQKREEEQKEKQMKEQKQKREEKGEITEAYLQAMSQLRAGKDLSRQASEAVMQAILAEEITPIQVAAFLTALTLKGEREEELIGLARAIRAKARPVNVELTKPLLDTCGTGGSGLPTTNISTMNAFVLASAGVKVAKHGNRASSGKFGSADLLEALGIGIRISPEKTAQLLKEIGLAFLFAPEYHPALKYLMPVRKQLGFATIFNFLGPLCNPTNPQLQLLGSSSMEKAPMMAKALLQLGIKHALVVHGENNGASGLDEFTLTGPTHIWEVVDGKIERHKFELSEVGLSALPFEAIAGGDKKFNCRLCEALLSGRERGSHALHLQLNVGAGLYLAGKAESIPTGYRAAEELLISAKPRELLERYREATLEHY